MVLSVAGATVLGVGLAYVAGDLAGRHANQARAQRMADAVSRGFSESALSARAEQMSPGAAAVARRHDPYTVAGAAQRDRQTALFAERLERRPDAPQGRNLHLRAALGPDLHPAARPFRLASLNALDGAREIDCLTQAVYYEARGETASGQAAVAQVVLNRVRHPAFPKTVCGVVFQGALKAGRSCQFSFACDGSMRKPVEAAAWGRARKVAARALDGFVMAQVGNATHFHAMRVGPAWGAEMVKVAEVGLHVFYRFGGRNGRPSTFRDPAPETPVEKPDLILASLTPAIDAAAAAERAVETVLPVLPAVLGVGGPLQAVEPASAPVLVDPAGRKPVQPLQPLQPVKAAAETEGAPAPSPVAPKPRPSAQAEAQPAA